MAGSWGHLVQGCLSCMALCWGMVIIQYCSLMLLLLMLLLLLLLLLGAAASAAVFSAAGPAHPQGVHQHPCCADERACSELCDFIGFHAPDSLIHGNSP